MNLFRWPGATTPEAHLEARCQALERRVAALEDELRSTDDYHSKLVDRVDAVEQRQHEVAGFVSSEKKLIWDAINHSGARIVELEARPQELNCQTCAVSHASLDGRLTGLAASYAGMRVDVDGVYDRLVAVEKMHVRSRRPHPKRRREKRR